MKFIDGVFIRYVGKIFVVRFAGLLLFFVIILQMLDLLNKSSDIYAAEGADWRSIIRYISLRAPEIATQFTPFAALLAVVLTLSMLNHRSEITIMRAAGMSVHRVLLPIGFFCFLVAGGHFLVHELITVRAMERLAFWEANEYAVNLPIESGTRTNVRMKLDYAFIRAESALRHDNVVVLNEVEIVNLDEAGKTIQTIDAKSATFENGAWRLDDLIERDAATLTTSQVTRRAWRTTLDPELLFAISINPDRTPMTDLIRQIEQLKRNGADITSAMTSLLGRFSRPLSTLVMPLLGAIAGFGVARQGAQLARAVVGAALGFGYFVIENMMLALGKLGAAPAALSAFFPFALFLVVGFTLLLLMEN